MERGGSTSTGRCAGRKLDRGGEGRNCDGYRAERQDLKTRTASWHRGGEGVLLARSQPNTDALASVCWTTRDNGAAVRSSTHR